MLTCIFVKGGSYYLKDFFQHFYHMHLCAFTYICISCICNFFHLLHMVVYVWREVSYSSKTDLMNLGRSMCINLFLYHNHCYFLHDIIRNIICRDNLFLYGHRTTKSKRTEETADPTEKPKLLARCNETPLSL